MKKKTAWNVIRWDFNADRRETYDVLPYFVSEYRGMKKKNRPKTREEVSLFLKNEAMRMFWSRCEHEILVGGLFGKVQEKIDVYGQLEMNWEPFVDAFCESVGLNE